MTQENIPAVRSNSFHNLPDYLAVIGSDILIGNSFIVDFGVDATNPAKLILDPNKEVLTSFHFSDFSSMIRDERFILINLTIEGLKIKAIWDTHAPVTAFSTKFIQAHPNFFKLFKSRKDKDAHGMRGTQNFYQFLKPICFGSKHCPYTTNYIVEHQLTFIGPEFENYEVILGNDFILSFNWYFDFNNQKYFVKPR